MRHIEVVEVRAWQRRVGAVAADPDRGAYAFSYDPSWLKTGIDLAPLTMPARAYREQRVLSDAHLAELHDGVLRCERALGRPADCEFSIVDDRVLWLQCRPMTALDHRGGPSTPASAAATIDHTGAQRP